MTVKKLLFEFVVTKFYVLMTDLVSLNKNIELKI